MHIGRNDGRKIRQFSLELLFVRIKHVQYSPVVINLISESFSDDTPIIPIETFHYLAQSHHINAGRFP
jgi:hypothetical protein